MVVKEVPYTLPREGWKFRGGAEQEPTKNAYKLYGGPWQRRLKGGPTAIAYSGAKMMRHNLLHIVWISILNFEFSFYCG
jgi:hypothetical protein